MNSENMWYLLPDDMKIMVGRIEDTTISADTGKWIVKVKDFMLRSKFTVPFLGEIVLAFAEDKQRWLKAGEVSAEGGVGYCCEEGEDEGETDNEATDSDAEEEDLDAEEEEEEGETGNEGSDSQRIVNSDWQDDDTNNAGHPLPPARSAYDSDDGGLEAYEAMLSQEQQIPSHRQFTRMVRYNDSEENPANYPTEHEYYQRQHGSDHNYQYGPTNNYL
jgi:hypothetical protein